MKDLLKNFRGKVLRIYTTSGIESYLGEIAEIEDEYVVIKGFFKEGDRTYLAIQYIESFKEEKNKITSQARRKVPLDECDRHESLVERL